MNSWMPFVVVFVTACGLALIVTPLAGRLGLRYAVSYTHLRAHET